MNSFDRILHKAKRNEPEAVIKLLKIYEPLINKASYTEHGPDEDLRQELILKFLLALKKFKA